MQSLGVSENRWELYRVLSEPVRLRLLALSAEEELAIGELAELLGESQPNVSRHVAPLRQAGLVSIRKQGTRALVRLADDATADPVVCDAVASGKALCDADGSRARVADVLSSRDAAAREFFARGGEVPASDRRAAPAELGAYLALVSALLPQRKLAIDAGTGDGGLLDVLCPTFQRVVAVDRAAPQLAKAKERVATRGYDNVRFALGELDGAEVREAAGAHGADAVFAARVLHHAARPAHVVTQLAALCRPGGALVVLDYARHDDESMRAQADVWLGFEPAELRRFARDAGLQGAHVAPLPSFLCGKGPDAHLIWQVMVARRPLEITQTDPVKKRKATAHG